MVIAITAMAIIYVVEQKLDDNEMAQQESYRQAHAIVEDENRFFPKKEAPKHLNEIDTTEDIISDDFTNSDLAEVSVLNEKEQRLLKKWEKERGYDLIDKKLELNGSEVEIVSHPTKDLPSDVLHGMAINADPEAQFFYGLRLIKENNVEATKWLKESAINGGYSISLNRISTFNSNKLFRDRHATLHNSDFNKQYSLTDAERNYHTNEALKWAYVSQKRNDVYADGIIESDIFELVSADTHTHLKIEAEALYDELRERRLSRGFPDFSNAEPSEGITAVLKDK